MIVCYLNRVQPSHLACEKTTTSMIIYSTPPCDCRDIFHQALLIIFNFNCNIYIIRKIFSGKTLNCLSAKWTISGMENSACDEAHKPQALARAVTFVSFPKVANPQEEYWFFFATPKIRWALRLSPKTHKNSTSTYVKHTNELLGAQMSGYFGAVSDDT